MAYEEGAERWGKDFGAHDTTGVALYQGRVIRIRGFEKDGRAIELPEPLSIRRPLNRPGTWPIGIPFRPLWTGLALNVLTLTLAWWIVLVVPFAMRDAVLVALRSRRGLCPSCAYDLRATPAGSPCPECGRTANNARPAPSLPI